MRKRRKFVLTALILVVAVAAMQMTPLEWRYGLVGLLSVVAWLLAAWSLREGLDGIEWLTVLLPTVLFTAGAGFFFILLPGEWWWRLLVLLLFGVGHYALLLTANIFSVAAIRTIALLRAASAVGFVMTLVTGFLLYNTLLSFRLPFWANGAGVAFLAFLLLLPGLWSVELEPRLSRKVMAFALWPAVIAGLLAMAISFWPITLAVSSLFLVTGLYVFLGLAQHHFSGRLFTRTIWEYTIVGMVVLITMLVTAG